MLAERFFLILESLIRTQGLVHTDGSPRVISSSPHVPVQVPLTQGKTEPSAKPPIAVLFTARLLGP